MTDNTYAFDIPPNDNSIIKVIGIGGGGSNAVNYMYSKGIKDVDFIVVNTDSQALKSSPVPNTLQIGVNLTAGLGAGANPEKGREAALENKEEIRDMLSDGTKMLFITAGMGGGTGTGAAPVFAEVARDLDVLTVGIVTAPFRFEGRRKMQQAMAGIAELEKYCDTVIVILNDKLKELTGSLPIRQAFAKADEVLSTAAKSIAEIISVHAEVNVDFEDVKTVMKDSGGSVMGSAITQGDARALRAAEEAIASPLLNNNDIQGANKILLSIMSGPDAELEMDELDEISIYINERAGGDDVDEVIWGHGIDETLGESIRVTVIATGIDVCFDDKMKSLVSSSRKSLATADVSSSAQESEAKKKIAEEPKEEQVVVEYKEELDPVEESAVTSEESVSEEVEEVSTDDLLEELVGATEELVEEPSPVSQVSASYGSEPDSFAQVQEPVLSEQEQKELLREKKRQELIRKGQERVERLKRMKAGNQELNEEDLKEKINVPAYIRRQKQLSNVPSDADGAVSRLQLNDETNTGSETNFVHDGLE